ncbi:LysM repeat protein [Anoxybacillus kamchatkensis]|nr:LysM domain-containing protein [Anoxybacillus ayderensis]MBA2878055.1 LysM repeat protein [Anoxybacillus ayderensis]
MVVAIELNGKSKLAGYEILVLDESINTGVTVTDHPVEQGFNISDHIEPETPTIELNAIIIRPTFERAQKAVDILESKMYKGERIVYEGKKIYPNFVIQSFKYNRNKNIKNGYNASITLKKVRIAQQSYVPTLPKERSQIKPVTNSGRKQTQNKPTNTAVYHTIRKGDTYWSIAPKYGTTWQAIQKLNPGVDPRKLQIGQKVRVK